MKCRVVKYANGRYGVQHRRLGVWFDEPEVDCNGDYCGVLSFVHKEEAVGYLKEWMLDDFRVIEILDISKENQNDRT